MPELWSVHATQDACELAMRAPGAGRVATDEVMVRGPVADDIRRAIRTVDPHAVIRDPAEGWTEIELPGGDARAVFARSSELRLPDGSGYVQGDVAGVGARIFVENDRIWLLVPASLGACFRQRLSAAGPDG
ncbi:MAG: hypothetical protein ACRDOP_10745 [Gaiellaceae bacterium]